MFFILSSRFNWFFLHIFTIKKFFFCAFIRRHTAIGNKQMSIRIEWNKLIRDFHSTHQSRCMYTPYLGAMLMFETFSKLCIVCCMLCCCRCRRRRHRCCTHFRNLNVTYGPNDIYLKRYRWKINNYFVHAPLLTTINSFDTFWMDENVLFTKTNDFSFRKFSFHWNYQS